MGAPVLLSSSILPKTAVYGGPEGEVGLGVLLS